MALCTDCSLFTNFLLANSFYLHGSPKFPPAKYFPCTVVLYCKNSWSTPVCTPSGVLPLGYKCIFQVDHGCLCYQHQGEMHSAMLHLHVCGTKCLTNCCAICQPPNTKMTNVSTKQFLLLGDKQGRREYHIPQCKLFPTSLCVS